MRQCLTRHLKCQFTLGVKLLSHISHCQTDSWNLRAEECSFYTSILSHIFKYHLGYVKVWFDNARSHLSAMTECVLRLSILGEFWELCVGRDSRAFQLHWHGVEHPAKCQGTSLGCPPSPAATSLAPQFSSEKIVFSGAHIGQTGAACWRGNWIQ